MKKIVSLILVVLMVSLSLSVLTVSSSAAEIISDGLVSWFDAKEYDGTTWTDKKGDNDITECVGEFKNGAYLLKAGELQTLPIGLFEVLEGDEFTFEMVLGESKLEGTTYLTWIANNPGTNAEKFAIYIQVSSGKLFVKTSGLASSARPNMAEALADGVNVVEDCTLSVTYKNGGKVSLYINGDLKAESDAPATNGNSGTTFELGAGESDAKKNTTEYRGLRFYNKALTATQIQNNVSADNPPIVQPWWNLSGGVLTINGVETVGSADAAQTDYPWDSQRSEITKVVVGDYIKEIGANSFTHCDNLKEVVLGSKCTVIGKDAFSYDAALEKITFNAALTSIGQGIVYSTNAITTVVINQTFEEFKTLATVKPYNFKDNGNIATGFDTASFIEPTTPPETVTPPVTVTPPQTGDATAVLAIIAVVALAGSAFVSKKVFSK